MAITQPRTLTQVLKDKRALSASLPEVLGAIVISVIVLGLVGAGIGAGIAFAQDSGAKATLESVKSAQLLYQAKNGGVFGDLDALTAGEAPALTGDVANVRIALSDDNRNYCAFAQSGSMFGTTYWLTAKTGTILEAAPTDLGFACPTSLD